MADSKNATGGMSRWWAVPALVVGGLVGGAVSLFGSIAMAEAAGISASVFTIMTAVYWQHHHERWFWAFLTAIGLAHAAAILFFPWPASHKLSKGDLIFVWPDFFLYAGLAFLVRRLSPQLAGRPNGS